MGKNLTPITKVSRRLGISLGKDKYARKRSYPPGIHGPKQVKSRKRLSSYGEQLQEKQKAKAIYGLLERQFRRFFAMAARQQGNTAEHLSQLLERRLDNVIYRLGFAQTRPQARQMVSHGFILVNQRRMDVPSFCVQIGDEISIKESKQQKELIKRNQEFSKTTSVPSWLSRDTALSGKVTAFPAQTDVESSFDSTLIVEFYSR